VRIILDFAAKADDDVEGRHRQLRRDEGAHHGGGAGRAARQAEEPKLWFTSTESFAKVLSAGNRELLRVIAERAPGSLDELARITGKAKSNLSRNIVNDGRIRPGQA
jgi:hypothetical protein